MKKSMVVVFSSLFILCFLTSCSYDLIELTKRYEFVFNTHNVESIVSLYSEDAVFEVVGQFQISGKNQIRDITKYDSILNIQMKITNIELKKILCFSICLKQMIG